MSATEWGPLQPLYEILTQEEQVHTGDNDRKQSDFTLMRVLLSEEMTTAMQSASIAQLDVALHHETLAVGSKPLGHLLLLFAKGQKLARWKTQRPSTENDALWRTTCASFIHQISHFLCQIPIPVAIKDLRRVSWLVQQYASLAVEFQQSLKIVFPLRSFLRRLHQHDQNTITPVHAQFLYICHQAKCYSVAMETLNHPLFEVHAQSTALDFLMYAYYAGVICIGEKQYQEALDFFTMAITAPAVALSAYVIKAQKKRILVSLIHHGQVSLLPKYTPFVVSRHLESNCAPYMELARVFTTSKSLTNLYSTVEMHSDLFLSDENMGLVKQVCHALQQQQLLALPQTYVTIGLDATSQVIGMDLRDPGVEQLMLTAIETGDMTAAMDQQKRMITFHLDEEATTIIRSQAMEQEQQMALEKLQFEMDKMMKISAHLRAMDFEIVTSNKFQSRLQKRGRGHQGGSGSSSTGGSGMDRFLGPGLIGGLDMMH